MNFPRRRFSSSSSIAAALLAAVALTVTGCSFDTIPNASSSGAADIAGILHGGPNPVVGATVTLYATQNNGYGGAGLQLAQTTTASNGSFSFNSSSYTCPAGQQAYVTAAGGNTGANSTNANSLLMAAVGPCSNLISTTTIWVDEPSTIAAAYALGNFITISGTGASTVVGVSAPANNNAATGSCTGIGTAMTCTAAGLAHAFLNAANLVSASDSSGLGTSKPTGQVYNTPPSNPTTSSTAAALQNVVPQQLIDSLANAVQACVNSSGETGTGDTTSGCGKLFTNTTVPSTYTSNATYTAKPANTLQALVNLAKFPFMTSGAVTNIFNLGSATSFYEPSLTAAPPDFSIAILFRSYDSGANEIGAVYDTTTDIDDNVYATALTAPSTGSITGALPYIAHALSSDGVGNWAAPATVLATGTFATYTCDSWANTAATSGACFAATDTAGHLWVGMGSNNFSGGGLWQVSTASGAVTPFNTTYSSTTYYPFALAVDRANDLFYSGTLNGADNLFELPSGSTSTTVPTPVSTGTSPSAIYAGAHLSDSLVFDTAGNLFAPLASGSNVGYAFFTNSGTLSAEAFATTANQCNCLGTATLGDDHWPTGGMVDASGNYWMTGQNGVAEIDGAADAQAATGGGSTGVSQYALGTAATTLRVSSMDGAGTIFVPDNDTSGSVNPQSGPPTAPAPALIIYYPALAAQATIQGCNVGTATGNATCITGNATAPNSGMFYQAVNPAIDATGSMWVSSGGNDAVIQVLGLAAPTWPQASYLQPAVMPH